MNPSELLSLLRRAIPSRLPILTIGPPGIGKSDIHAQTAQELGYDYQVIYPSLLDPTDMSGLPVPTGTGANRRVERLIDDLLGSILRATRPTLVLLDELGQASPAMQSACAPLLLARTIAGHRIPDHVAICAATNRRRDRAGANHLLTHLLSRMCTIVELSPDIDSWCGWALSHKIRPEIISFLRFRTPLLTATDTDLEQAYSDGGAYPSPRSWTHASQLLDADVPRDIEGEALRGSVGTGAATELLAHLAMVRTKINIDTILEGGKLPSGPSALYATAAGAACRANAKTANSILGLAQRLHATAAEYAILLLRDALVVYPEIVRSPAWGEIVAGPLGQAIRHA